MTGEATPTATGFLEVQVVGGALLHSKKNGQGYVDTAAKMQAMCAPASHSRPHPRSRARIRARAAPLRRLGTFIALTLHQPPRDTPPCADARRGCAAWPA